MNASGPLNHEVKMASVLADPQAICLPVIQDANIKSLSSHEASMIGVMHNPTPIYINGTNTNASAIISDNRSNGDVSSSSPSDNKTVIVHGKKKAKLLVRTLHDPKPNPEEESLFDSVPVSVTGVNLQKMSYKYYQEYTPEAVSQFFSPNDVIIIIQEMSKYSEGNPYGMIVMTFMGKYADMVIFPEPDARVVFVRNLNTGLWNRWTKNEFADFIGATLKNDIRLLLKHFERMTEEKMKTEKADDIEGVRNNGVAVVKRVNQLIDKFFKNKRGHNELAEVIAAAWYKYEDTTKKINHRIKHLKLNANSHQLPLSGNKVIDLRGDITVKDMNENTFWTDCVGVTYDPEAKSPALHDFLHKFTCEDRELEHYLQVICGIFLIGKNMLKKIIFFYGPSGNNGKSTLICLIMKILGTEDKNLEEDEDEMDDDPNVTVKFCKVADKSILTAGKKGEGPQPFTASLAKKRFVAIHEVGAKDVFSGSKIRQLASGFDRIETRDIREKATSIKPDFNLALGGNGHFRIDGEIQVTRGRIDVFPANHSFGSANVSRKEQSKIDRLFLSKLKPSDYSWFLNWCLEGLRYYNRNQELPECKAVKAATEEFYRSSDKVYGFLSEIYTWKDGEDSKEADSPFVCNSEIWDHFVAWMGVRYKGSQVMHSNPFFIAVTRILGESKRKKINGSTQRGHYLSVRKREDIDKEVFDVLFPKKASLSTSGKPAPKC